MLDREKIIKGLEWVLEDDRFSFGEGWPIDSKPQTEEEQAGYYIQRAIDFLKAQEAIEPEKDVARNRRCPKCFTILKGKFCHECGQAVKWE